MKKFGIFLLIMTMSLMSCNKDDDNDPLVGTWVISYTDYGTIYLDEITFNSDNTGTVSNKEDGIEVDIFSFTWSTNKNVLTVSYDGDTYTTVYAISGNKLTMDGEVYTKK